MVDYLLKLEYNRGDKLLFAVQHEEQDVALLRLEDCQRKGELLRDFPFLCPQYYASEQEWDDERNLIVISVFPLLETELSPEIRDDLECLAESLVEYKPAVNHKVQFVDDSRVRACYAERSENRLRFINYLLSLCERKETVSFGEDAFNHITQPPTDELSFQSENF
ncbi:MAG: hypothetical protein LUH45_06750 [Clostridiales bacterium]|nr:hypothetical protein [Clostridiales bacterium]